MMDVGVLFMGEQQSSVDHGGRLPACRARTAAAERTRDQAFSKNSAWSGPRSSLIAAARPG
jgi:hypothetical protein